MSQKTNNIYSLLSNTFVYSFVQMIMSGTTFRKKIVKKNIIREKVNVLDIGCGPAEILDSLPNVRYYGYDINHTYISHAKRKYGSKGKFYCKKFTKSEIKKLPKFDHVLLLGILHHLNDEEIKDLMQLLKKVLKKSGNIISQDPILIEKQNLLARFIINRDRGNNVRNKNGYTKIIKKYFKNINSKIYHQKFIPYTWFVMVFKT